MGHKPDGHEITPGQMVYVIEAACDDCDIHKVRITDNCRKCLFKPCQSACHFGAIFQGNSKMHIDYSKCKIPIRHYIGKSPAISDLHYPIPLNKHHPNNHIGHYRNT